MTNTIRRKYYIPLLIITTSLLSSDATDFVNSSRIVIDKDGNTMTSSQGTFELGFFSPENSKSRYVGIWYKRTTPRTVVWVANRDNPLTDTSGTLRLIEPGRLLLQDGDGRTIWSTNASTNVKTSVAELLDSGNLVVRNADGDSKESFIWQSFDYPTDTFLPGMKLGKNFITGHEVYIKSWNGTTDPASGDYTYNCDPAGYPQHVLRSNASVRFKTGPWNGIRFSGAPETIFPNPYFTSEIVITKDEAYYQYQLRNTSIYVRTIVTERGVADRYIWDNQTKNWIIYFRIPGDGCDVYNACGPYGTCSMIQNSAICGCFNKFEPKDAQDPYKGCIRSKPLNCEDGDAFLEYSGVKFPDTQNSWFNETMNLEECKVLCLSNCSCTAYTTLNISSETGAYFGPVILLKLECYLQDNISISGWLLPRKFSDNQVKKDNSGDLKGRKREIIIVSLSLVIGISLVCLSMLLCSWRRKKLYHQLPKKALVAGRLRLKDADKHPEESEVDLELPQFELSTIVKATDNFSTNNKLGQGGFGPVYKGLLGEGQEIAVKRLSRTSHQGMDEFKNEVICYAKLQRRNLVKLLGCCIQGDEIMLVYEYMKNGSLDLVLFDPTKCLSLEWHVRFNIINGIARGLLYLHQDSRLRVIHRDLKVSNILQDSNMNPKISDFGLARTVGGNETGANTIRVVGTYGYMSPEYAGEGLFSVKSDVFSFGVIMIEIVSGKKNRGFLHSDHPGVNLLGHAWMLNRDEKSWELVDTCIRNSCNLREIVRSIQIGLLCVQENPEDRPSMSSVVMMLTNDIALPEAMHPGFFLGRDSQKNETSTSSGSGSSINKITTSLSHGR